MTNDKTKIVLSQLENQKCQGILSVAGGILVLYIGDIIQEMTEYIPLKTEWYFWIKCAWRLYDGDKILTGYFDELKFSSEKIKELEGSILVEVEHDEMSYDLTLKFSNGMQLDVFTYSTEDEQWLLRSADGYRYGIEENLTPREWMDEPDE